MDSWTQIRSGKDSIGENHRGSTYGAFGGQRLKRLTGPRGPVYGSSMTSRRRPEQRTTPEIHGTRPCGKRKRRRIPTLLSLPFFFPPPPPPPPGGDNSSESTKSLDTSAPRHARVSLATEKRGACRTADLAGLCVSPSTEETARSHPGPRLPPGSSFSLRFALCRAT